MDNNQNNGLVTNNTNSSNVDVNNNVNSGVGPVGFNNVNNNVGSVSDINATVNANNASNGVASSPSVDVNNMSRIIGADNNSSIHAGAFNRVNNTTTAEQNNNSVVTNSSRNVESLEASESVPVVSGVDSSSNNVSSSTKGEYTGYREPGNGRFFMLFLLFGGLLALVYFLPDISEYLAVKKAEKDAGNTVITTGTLVCEFSNNSDTLTYDHEIKFYYTDSMLEELDYIVTTKGDKTLDLDALQAVYDECRNLSNNTRDLMGVSVTCELNTSNVVQAQSIDYSAINLEFVTAAYAEAGGLYPEFENGQSIDTIERNMNASGYSCRRVG